MSLTEPQTAGPLTAAVPQPGFGHLSALTDEIGTFEHADHAAPRREHGYCTDDAARVLVVTCREPDPSQMVRSLAHTALRFVADSQEPDGSVWNRRTPAGHWAGKATVEDCWGRSLWGLGTAVARNPELAADASPLFERGVARRSPWLRSMAFAALGAAEVHAVQPGHPGASSLLTDTAARLAAVRPTAEWLWPEPRLTYANAALPEALVAAGQALDRPDWLEQGLGLLAWLLEHESGDGHLSVVAVTGDGPGEHPSRYDQQPIEVAALADACARAWHCTGDARWADAVRAAAAWFDGDNDGRATMWDPLTGGGYDGLGEQGASRNQGAESTLAMLATFQQARLLEAVAA